MTALEAILFITSTALALAVGYALGYMDRGVKAEDEVAQAKEQGRHEATHEARKAAERYEHAQGRHDDIPDEPDALEAVQKVVRDRRRFEAQANEKQRREIERRNK